MTRTLWAVIGLVTANLTLPAVAVQLATRGIDPLALIGLNAVAIFTGLALAALDPQGLIRRDLDASEHVEPVWPAPTPAAEEAPAHA